MRTAVSVGAACLLLSLASACTTPRTRSEYDEVEGLGARLTPATATLDQDEASLSREARLDAILRIAIARNPELLSVRLRVEAAVSKARSIGHLPDLEFKYELWGQPLKHPVSFGQANAHMFGLRQTFPAAGSLDAKARVALEEARIELETALARAQDVEGEARSAYADYSGAFREHVLHLEHVGVASTMVDLAKANYGAGKGTQQDVLRVMVALSRIHADIADVAARVTTSKARLNTLMGRDLDAPLGPPAEFDPAKAAPRFDELEKAIKERRPEVAEALTAVRKSEAELDDATARAHWPVFMVGADYMYMPMMEAPHAYGAMVSISLPWLNPAHAEEVDAAKKSVAADKAAVASIVRAIAYQLRDAQARFMAAKEGLAVIDRDLMPQAKASFDTARASFVVGGGDSLSLLDAFRAYVDVRLLRVRAVARLQLALADVERAAGLDAPDAPDTKGGAS